MKDVDFKKMMDSASEMTTDQKLTFCRAMGVVPLSYTSRKEKHLAETPGPLGRLMSVVANTCNMVKTTYEGIYSNKYKLADPKLAELLDFENMAEEGIVAKTCEALQEYCSDLAEARGNAKTNFAKRREESWKKHRKPKGKGKNKDTKPQKANAVSTDKTKQPKADKTKPVETQPAQPGADPKAEKSDKDEIAEKQKLVAAIKKLTGDEVKDSLALSTLRKKYSEAKKAAENKAA